MVETIDLAQQLIKATGLTLKDADKYQLTHLNVSKSDNFNFNPNARTGEEVENGDVVIKAVLGKRIMKQV